MTNIFRLKFAAFSILLMLVSSVSLYAQIPKYQYGIASWYGSEYEGKKTANGEIYDPNKLTAAHKTLPFGSKVQVENLENGKSVIVIINDRGPFVENRIIDLSQKAAEKLAFTDRGTTYVKTTYLNDNTEDSTATTTDTEDTTPSVATDTEDTTSSVATDTEDTTPSVATEVDDTVVSDDTPIEVPETRVQPEVVDDIETTTLSVDDAAVRTNFVSITNYVNKDTGPLTNRFVENDINFNNKNFDDEFIVEEPIEEPLIPIDDFTVVSNNTKNVVNLDDVDTPTEKKSLVLDYIPVTTNVINLYITNKPDIVDEPVVVDEVEITPDILLSNESETAIKVEKKEIRNELSDEIPIETVKEVDIHIPADIPAEIPENPKISDNSEKRGEAILNPKITADEYGYSYAVQVGAFRKEANALGLYDRLKSRGFDAFMTEVVVKGKNFTRVRVGYFNSLSKAKSTIAELRRLNLPGLVVKIKFASYGK